MYSTRRSQYTPKSVYFTMSMIYVSKRWCKTSFRHTGYYNECKVQIVSTFSPLILLQFTLSKCQELTCQPKQLRFRNLGVKLPVNQSVLRINQNILCLPEFHGCDGCQAELFQCNFQSVNGQLQVFALQFNQLENAGIVFIFGTKCGLQSSERFIQLDLSILLFNFGNLDPSVRIKPVEQVDSGSKSDIIPVCLALQD